ncbi:uncharacterized protein TNCV_1177081 [Trichonephila clavipes]|nr:uncharacterized protein TNCV_1177081 [Trichonephila clavipes]
MLIYEFPSSSLRCRANPNLFRRSFEPYDQMLYHRMVLEPHTAYPIPAGTRYIFLTVQKTVFGLDIIPETNLPQLMENGFNLGDFRKMKRYDQKVYKLPPPTSAHVSEETNKRPLEPQAWPSSKRNRVFITPVIRPPVLIARPSTALATPQPVSIPEPPVLTTPQILLPDPPPELTTPLVQIPDPPVQIPVFQTPVQISSVPTTPPVQIPDPPPELTTPLVQIPVFQPPVLLFLPDPSTRSTTCDRDFEADPYGRLFNRSDHVVRIWRLLATSPGSYPRTSIARHGAFPV